MAPRRARSRARALAARGASLVGRERYRGAEPVLRRALAESEIAFGPDARAVAAVLANLGACCRALARFTDAGPLYQRALHILERRLGPAHADVASIYHELGALEHAAGNWMRGVPFVRRALRIRARTLGPDHPLVASEMIALAALLDRQKRDVEAERLYQRAVAILERADGPEHPEIAVALNNLGAIAHARGRLRRAEALYRRALAIDLARFGADHVKVAFCANNLAMVALARGRHEDAGRLSRWALTAFRRTLGSEHPIVGQCLENRADILRGLDRTRQAAAAAKRARRILGRIQAVNDEGVAATATINPQSAWFRLIVGPSPINRLGVFAAERIPARRRVIEFTGEHIGIREARRRWDPARSYTFKLDRYWRIDGAIGGSGAEYVNHSCAPNLRARIVGKRIFYFSRQTIAEGEELTIDYHYASKVHALPCHCGAPTCRGTMNRYRRRDSSKVSRQPALVGRQSSEPTGS